METMNPSIQIMHYADISRYCTRSHLTGSFIVLLVTCYQVTTAEKRFSRANVCPVLKYLTSEVTVARDNHWSGFYLVKAPYHDCFMMIIVFWKAYYIR